MNHQPQQKVNQFFESADPSIHTMRLQRAIMDQLDLMQTLSPEQLDRLNVSCERFTIWLEYLLAEVEDQGTPSEEQLAQLINQLKAYVQAQKLLSNRPD